MFQHRQTLRLALAISGGVAMFAVVCGPAFGQADGIGARGGLTAPIASALPTPTLPTLPAGLNLPPQAASSLLNGLNASGTALRPGMGWFVSDMTHQGFHGRQLADMIHQLKPYKQRGVLNFPQNQQPTGGLLGGQPLRQQWSPPWSGGGKGFGGGNGNGGGKGGGKKGGKG